MIVMQGVEGFNGRAFGQAENGAASFTAGVNFECGKTICWAKGKANDAILKALQGALNRFANQLGFSPIYVDGFIGAQTVKAAQAVVQGTGMAMNPVMLAASASKEALTALAPSFTSQLLEMAEAQSLAPVPAPKVSTAPKTTAQKQEEAAAAAATGTKAEAGGRGWIWWVLGGVAVAGIATVGYMTYKRRQEGGAMAPAMTGYHGYYR
jgi:hypothetical protein